MLSFFRKITKLFIKFFDLFLPNFISKRIKQLLFDFLVYTKSSFVKVNKQFTYLNQPLILIGQIQRSGGTLLTQLFDKHPNLISHPYEIYIGYPKKWNWPKIKILETKKNPTKTFNKLSNRVTQESLVFGYSKFSNPENKNEIIDFKFNYIYQKKLFKRLIKNKKLKNKRNILNIWFTSYFNSFQKINLMKKKFIFGFVPRFNLYDENIENFFNDYPDGKIIHIIRNPVNWYSSSKKHSEEYKNLVKSIRLWNKSSLKAIALSKKYKNFKVILFEDLVKKTEKTTKILCQWIKIKWKKNLLVPTYDGKTIKADTSFKVKTSGKILKETLNRSQYLSKKEIDYIKKRTDRIYSKTINNFKI